jgi:hypothetical protein
MGHINSERGFTRQRRIAGVVCALVIAGPAMFAVSGTAQAATAAGPSASLAFASASVSAGTQPVITYLTSDSPAGSAIYLQQATGSGQGCHDVGRIQADSGTVKAPADPAGSYEYRIVIAQGNTAVATSAPSTLTVTGSSASAGSCTVCKVAKAALPWLAPVAAPVISGVLEQVGQAILDFLGFLFGV